MFAGATMGSVLHGRSRGAEDDCDPTARVHRSRHIYLDGKNVLSLVVEIDVATLLRCDAPVLAVITETLTRGKFPVRVRACRPARSEEPHACAKAVRSP